MRAQEAWGYYKILHADGKPRVGHFIVGRQPDGAEEIDLETAKRIDAELDEQSASPGEMTIAPASSIDITPLLDKIDALSKIVTEHAALHDQHAEKIAAHEEDLATHADAIANVKVTTAKAISAALDGLGETKT